MPEQIRSRAAETTVAGIHPHTPLTHDVQRMRMLSAEDNTRVRHRQSERRSTAPRQTQRSVAERPPLKKHNDACSMMKARAMRENEAHPGPARALKIPTVVHEHHVAFPHVETALDLPPKFQNSSPSGRVPRCGILAQRAINSIIEELIETAIESIGPSGTLREHLEPVNCGPKQWLLGGEHVS